MKAKELKKVRKRLDRFLDDPLQLLGRSERRRAAAFYVQGLLLETERKNVSAIAKCIPDCDSQAIQQMLQASPWDHHNVLQTLTQRTISELKPVKVWMIDDTGFPKKGDQSVGVAHQYSGSLGKVGNCQVAVSLNYATEQFSFPMDWMLYLPKSWTDDPVRRKKTGIPEDVIHKRKWELALDLIDRALEAKTAVGVIVADAAYGTCTQFRQYLESRNLEYSVGIKGDEGFWRERMIRRDKPYPKVGKGRSQRYDPSKQPQSARQIAKSLPEESWQEITYWFGAKGPKKAYFTALRVQSSYLHHHNAPEQPMTWLLIQKTGKEDQPFKYYLSNLPESTSLSKLVRITKLRWRIEMDYQVLKSEIGLDHYEGRSLRGWYHHVTLVTMAFVFLLLERLQGAFPPDSVPNSQTITPESNIG